MRRLSRSLAFAVALSGLVTLTACFGSFRVTRAVYTFNQNLSSNRVVQSLMMWVLLIIPVYEVAGLADVLVLNTIESLSGGGGKVARVEHLPDGTVARFERIAPDTVRIERTRPDGQVDRAEVVLSGDHAGFVRDGQGRIVAAVEVLPDGRIVTR
jgi:hypothetical protein